MAIDLAAHAVRMGNHSIGMSKNLCDLVDDTSDMFLKSRLNLLTQLFTARKEVKALCGLGILLHRALDLLATRFLSLPK